MAKKFAEHDGLNLPQTNQQVLEQWNAEDVFHKSVTEREGCPQFVFYEGPPSANGHPGIHHVLLWNLVWKKNWVLLTLILIIRIQKNIFLWRNTITDVARM